MHVLSALVTLVMEAGGTAHPTDEVLECIDSGLAFLDQVAREKWEAILYYMVGSTGTSLAGGSTVTEGTKALLKMGHFVEARGATTSITQPGFTFLLQEANAQVWSLLIVYLENAPNVCPGIPSSCRTPFTDDST